jgi:plastocyanin
MQRRLLTLIAISALAVGLAACGSSSKAAAPAASEPAQITIDSAFKFIVTPVKAGSTVTVKNDSNAQHTVTADDTAGGFNVTIDAGKTATFPAPAAGTYKFHCNIHNFMKGTLTVSS